MTCRIGGRCRKRQRVRRTLQRERQERGGRRRGLQMVYTGGEKQHCPSLTNRRTLHPRTPGWVWKIVSPNYNICLVGKPSLIVIRIFRTNYQENPPFSLSGLSVLTIRRILFSSLSGLSVLTIRRIIFSSLSGLSVQTIRRIIFSSLSGLSVPTIRRILFSSLSGFELEYFPSQL